MTFDEYVAEKRLKTPKKPNADIAQRWEQRVVPRKLHLIGASGAAQYLADYGKGIAAPKVIALAFHAEAKGHPDMAVGFWRRAYKLETGQDAPTFFSTSRVLTAQAPTYEEPALPHVEGLPEHLQPGKIVPMQPVDAKHPRYHYIGNSDYVGQPKRDGHKVLVIAGEEGVFYQSRSMKLRGPISPEIDAALKLAVEDFGPYVLEGEAVFYGVDGNEYRTGAEAATTNIAAGMGSVQPAPVYCIFKALACSGSDLTQRSEISRINAGAYIGSTLVARNCMSFELLPTARTKEEKQALCDKQLAEGREGEVWIRADQRYTPGKDEVQDTYVRTKYKDQRPVLITGLTPTTAAGRPFGAIEVSSLEGEPLGAVGTGYTVAQMWKIVEQHKNYPQRPIIIETQGYTVNGQLHHGTFHGFTEAE